MCGDYYHDYNKHRYVDCIYFNGCPCGMKSVPTDHKEKCFYWRDRRYKASKEAHPPSSTNMVCSLCGEAYRSGFNDHRDRDCQYYVGCRKCSKRYAAYDHFKNCTGPIIPMVRGEFSGGGLAPHSYPGYNDGPYPPTSYPKPTYPYAHAVKVLCSDCNEYVVEEYMDKHKQYCPAKELPYMKRCSLCNHKVHQDALASHRSDCMKAVQEKFSKAATAVGEPNIVDLRQRKVAKGERVVTFKEGP